MATFKNRYAVRVQILSLVVFTKCEQSADINVSWRDVMNIGIAKCFLLWSLIINYGILVVWFVAFWFAHDWLFRLHGRWFHLSHEQFDAAHYMGMAVYKIGILLFNLVPYIALVIAGRSS